MLWVDRFNSAPSILCIADGPAIGASRIISCLHLSAIGERALPRALRFSNSPWPSTVGCRHGCCVAAARTLAFGQTTAGFIAGESAACVAPVKSCGRHREKTADTPKRRLISITYRPFACLWIGELPLKSIKNTGAIDIYCASIRWSEHPLAPKSV